MVVFGKQHENGRLRTAAAQDYFDLMRYMETSPDAAEVQTGGAVHRQSVGALLALWTVTWACQARTVLEIGVGPEACSGTTFAYAMRRRLPATLISIEIDPRRPRPQDRKRIADLGVDWRVYHGDSLTVDVPDIPLLDVLFVDGDHDFVHALGDFERFEPFLRPGGYAVVDDWDVFAGVRQARAVLEEQGFHFVHLDNSDLDGNGRLVWRKPGGLKG